MVVGVACRFAWAAMLCGAGSTLERLKRPVGKFHPARYFRGADDLGFYNVGTEAMRAQARSIYLARRKDWSIDDAMTFAGAMIRDRHLEAKSLGRNLREESLEPGGDREIRACQQAA